MKRQSELYSDIQKFRIKSLNINNLSTPAIINALYDIIYQQEYISWKLPSNTHIFLSANPDNGQYSVTSIDEAAASRMVTFNIKFDVEA